MHHSMGGSGVVARGGTEEGEEVCGFCSESSVKVPGELSSSKEGVFGGVEELVVNKFT